MNAAGFRFFIVIRDAAVSRMQEEWGAAVNVSMKALTHVGGFRIVKNRLWELEQSKGIGNARCNCLITVSPVLTASPIREADWRDPRG
jgi:hypothetical protein